MKSQDDSGTALELSWIENIETELFGTIATLGKNSTIAKRLWKMINFNLGLFLPEVLSVFSVKNWMLLSQNKYTCITQLWNY